jgi:hypothetical protein
MKADAMARAQSNPIVRSMLAANINNVLAETHGVTLNSDAPVGMEWDVACSLVLGKLGWRPPWPSGPQQTADWELDQVMRLLKRAEVFVISPAAHAAVMAAAETVEPADVTTLDRDRDIVVPEGLLVLPEPVVIENRTGSLSDTAAFGWQFIVQHQILPTTQYPGVQITTFMDRDGPVQPDGWRATVSYARTAGSPLPRLIPDGAYGVRADGGTAGATDETLAEITDAHHQWQSALRQASRWRTEIPEEGEWGGGTIKDPDDDFAARYMFAFWRLAAQEVTTTEPVTQTISETSTPQQHTAPQDPEVRVIHLRPQSSLSAGATSGTIREYHHRSGTPHHLARPLHQGTSRRASHGRREDVCGRSLATCPCGALGSGTGPATPFRRNWLNPTPSAGRAC